MKIVRRYTPDQAYITISDVSPLLEIQNTQISICDNQAARNRKTKAETAIVFGGKDLVAFHVTYSSKHSRGQGWFYYKPANKGWKRVRWNHLTRKDQQKVFDRIYRAPDYAKSPGKLRD